MRGLRIATIATVTGIAIAYAVGNGDITANPDVNVLTITTTLGGGTTMTTVQNTTASTGYTMLVGSDATCDPAMSFSVAGGNPVVVGAGTSRQVTISCPSRGSAAMRRCLYHATNNANGTPLADFLGVCLYGANPGTLTPLQSSLNFGTVVVGDSAQLQLELRNNGAQTITHVFLQSSDLAGDFQFSTPCNPDAAFCDDDLSAPVPPGNNIALQIRCTPQTAGVHTAQLFVGTNTFQLLASPVTLSCTGGVPTTPVLGANPTNIELQAPTEVVSGSANVVVHLANAGLGTLMINDVRTVDVDTGAAADWTYNASGGCTGQITAGCSLDAGKQVDINLRFDPNAIGRRRATLLISYRDTVDRTKEIALDGTGLGATLQLANGTTTFPFGMVPVGRPSQLDFSLINRGNRDVTAQLSLDNGTSPPFTLNPPASTLVMPNVERTISLTCTPSAAGSFTTTVTAQAIDAFMSPAVAVNASCQGSLLQLYSAPTAIHLGEVRLGTSVRHTVQLLSVGAPLTLTGQPELETSDPGNVSIGALSQSTTPAVFEVTITPQAEGQLNHTIVIAAEGETLRIPLIGKAVKAEYAVAPMLDLGTFCVGQPTTSSNLALLASGTGTIGVMQPTLGQSPSPFQLALITPSGYPSTLPAGTSARVAVTPQRQMGVTTLTDTLTWRTDVAAAPTATTALSAKFLDSGGAIAPPTLDFGKVTVHLFSDNGQRVMIQNCNPTPLMLDTPMIKTPFSIDSPNFPGMLAPNETVTFSLGFHPTRIGQITETLRITSPQLPDAPLEVTVTGEGVAGGPDLPDAGSGSNGVGNTSFYACACSGSGAPSRGWPVLAALMIIVRRRRGSSSAR